MCPVHPGEIRDEHLGGDQLGENPCESVEPVSSVVHKFREVLPHRPRMTLIRRISTDDNPKWQYATKTHLCGDVPRRPFRGLRLAFEKLIR